jgi:hypothetical protein
MNKDCNFTDLSLSRQEIIAQSSTALVIALEKLSKATGIPVANLQQEIYLIAKSTTDTTPEALTQMMQTLDLTVTYRQSTN